jgi:hypothetical protein
MAEEMREAAGEDEQVNRTLFKMQIKFVFTIASFLYFHLRIWQFCFNYLQELANEMAEAFLNEHLPESLFGAPKAGPGMWASCIRVLDPSEGNTLQQISLEQNEAAVRFVSLSLK